jgi:predicted dehydrogenase
MRWRRPGVGSWIRGRTRCIRVRLTSRAILLAGTGGALSIPQLKRWHYNEVDGGWHQPLLQAQESFSTDEALRLQLQHFVRVARREVEPLVSAADAARTLALIEAIREAAETGRACAPCIDRG